MWVLRQWVWMALALLAGVAMPSRVLASSPRLGAGAGAGQLAPSGQATCLARLGELFRNGAAPAGQERPGAADGKLAKGDGEGPPDLDLRHGAWPSARLRPRRRGPDSPGLPVRQRAITLQGLSPEQGGQNGPPEASARS
jgi:hypothetical protein